MLVKICGLTNGIDAHAAVDAGASALGFVMGGKVLPVEIEPPAQIVREIIKTIPAKKTDTFIVTHLTVPQDIAALAEYVNSSGIQVSEDIGVEALKEVRKLTGRLIIKTVVVKDETSIERLKNYEPHCDFILLDSQVAGYTGGTGHTSDWSLCKEMVKAARKPVYLAGGLTPDNVADGIRQVSPDGVDVSTGISTYSDSFLRKDRKDSLKIQKFISTARSLVSHAVS